MPPRDVFEGGPDRGQRERLDAQIGRRGSTRGRSDQDPRGMYGPREQTGTVTADLGDDRTQEVAVYGGPTQQINTGFDFGTGDKSGTLSQQEFMNITGRTATNPYGKQGLFTRLFGIDPNNLDYSGITPGGIATLNRVNALAYDQYLNPRDARGNIRGMLREGSPTRFGTVVNDPTLETDLGIMGAIPYVGGFLRAANRRSALNISPYDNPLFSDMSDMGNELGAFPVPPLENPYDIDSIEAIAPLGSPAPTATSMPTAMELRGDRINRNVAELQRATADFPDAASVPGAIQVSSPVSSLDRREYRPSVVSSLPDYDEMIGADVGATPEQSGTYIVGNTIAPASESFMEYTIEGTTPAEQDYLREIRTDDLIYDMPYPEPPSQQLRNINEPLRLPGLF